MEPLHPATRHSARKPTRTQGSPRRLTNADYSLLSSPCRMYLYTDERRVDLHWHEFFELGFVLSGEAVQLLNGKPSKLERGTLFLLTPADFHEIVPSSTLVYYNLIFTEEALKDELYSWLFGENRELLCSIPPERCDDMHADFRRIRDELNDVSARGSHLVVQGTLDRILIELMRRVPPAEDNIGGAGSNSSAEEAVRRVISYLQVHFREPLALGDAARRAGLSPNYFSQMFHRITGIPFQNYLQALRLQFAHSLLRVSELPVTDVCFSSGFNTLSHFERAFKAKFGVPPKYVRREVAE